MVIDEEGVEPLISELVKGVGDSQVLLITDGLQFPQYLVLATSVLFCDNLCQQAAVRRSSSYLIGYFFKNSKLYLVDEAPNMISTLIVLLSDPDSSVVTVS